jgi:hypothetical protein
MTQVAPLSGDHETTTEWCLQEALNQGLALHDVTYNDPIHSLQGLTKLTSDKTNFKPDKLLVLVDPRKSTAAIMKPAFGMWRNGGFIAGGQLQYGRQPHQFIQAAKNGGKDIILISAAIAAGYAFYTCTGTGNQRPPVSVPIKLSIIGFPVNDIILYCNVCRREPRLLHWEHSRWELRMLQEWPRARTMMS